MMIIYVGLDHDRIAEPLQAKVRTEASLVCLIPTGYGSRQAIGFANDPDWKCPLVIIESWHEEGQSEKVICEVDGAKVVVLKRTDRFLPPPEILAKAHAVFEVPEVANEADDEVVVLALQQILSDI